MDASIEEASSEEGLKTSIYAAIDLFSSKSAMDSP